MPEIDFSDILPQESSRASTVEVPPAGRESESRPIDFTDISSEGIDFTDIQAPKESGAGSSFLAQLGAIANKVAASISDIPRSVESGEGAKAFSEENQARVTELQSEIENARSLFKDKMSGIPWWNLSAQGAAAQEFEGEQNKRLSELKELTSPRSETLGELFRSAATESFPAYGASPESKNIGAQVGRGGATVAGMVPAMLAGEAAFPLMALQGAGDAYQSTLMAGGTTEQAKEAAFKTAPHLLLYMAGGKAASGLAGKLLGKEASTLTRGLTGAGTATVANVATSSVLRALEAKKGEKLSAAIPTIETLTADTLFGVYHGIGEYRKASLEVKRKAYQELQDRGFSKEEIKQTVAEQKAEAVVEKSPVEMVVESAKPPPTMAPEPERPTIAPEPVKAFDPSIDLVPHPATQKGEHIISTGILTPEGIAYGPDWNTRHADISKLEGPGKEIILKAMDEGMDFDQVESNKGFIVQDANGKRRFVGRGEAINIARKSGQVDESKLFTKDKLISEALIQPKGGEQNATQERKVEQDNQPERPQAPPRGETTSPSRSDSVPTGGTETKVTPDQAAKELQQYRDQAIQAAKNAGATDPEAAASDAQMEMAEKGITDPKQFIGTARNRGIDQARKAKPTVAKKEAPEPKTETGPRAEAVAKETAQSIEDVVSSMPENDRKVMRAYMEGAGSDQDIAEETGLTLDQVKKAKSRARKVLAQFVKSQGIGERMAPGASNIKELRNARYLVAADLLRESGSKAEWTKKMEEEFGDIMTPEEINDSYVIAQEALEQHKESEGRKPLPKIIDQLSGASVGEGITGIKNTQTDIERQKRGLPPAMKAARRKHIQVWDEAMRALDKDPQLGNETIQKFLDDPTLTPTDTEVAILEHQQILRENEYDQAIDDVNNAKTPEEKAKAWSRATEIAPKLGQLYDVERSAGTAAGRSLAARRMMAGRDYTLQRMQAEMQAAKGEPLTEKENQKIIEEYEQIRQTNADLEARINQLEEEAARKAYDQTIDEMGTPEDPVTKSLVQRIVERLNSAADKARERIRARLQKTSAGLDPTVLYDVAIIGASKIANGLTRKSKWRASMKEDLEEFVPGIGDALDEVWDEANRMVDQGVEKVVPQKDREKVKKIVKSTAPADAVTELGKRMKGRVEEGKTLKELRAYVRKMALALTRGGVTDRDALLKTVHSELKNIDPNISERETMDLISGYGDAKALDKEQAKVILRDNAGQMQQLAKLEDLAKKLPLQKTGIERRGVSDAERRLIKQVNELKKKMGVVVTDPEKQLKSTLDSIKTRVRNEISDLTHQIETGEVPVEGTPAPTSQEIENLKALRDRLRQTLKDIEGPKTLTDEQRAKIAERSLESQIADYEARIKSGDVGPKEKGKQVSTPKIEALKARRDALKADLDTLRSANTDLEQTKRFDALMKTAAELEGKLFRGEIQPETKAAKIEDELVTEARKTVQDLRTQMKLARQASPEGQKARLDAAISAVEKSIQNYDQRLQSGNIAPSGKTQPTSPLLERLKAERDAMRKLVSELRKGPALSPEEMSIRAMKNSLNRRNAEMLDRIARSDFEPKKRREVDISKDPEAVRLKAENDRIKEQYEKRKAEYAIAHESKLDTVLRHIVKAKNTAREVKSSIDFSAIARQGGPLAAIFPVQASKNAVESVRQAFSESRFRKSEAEIRSRPNAPLYKSSGLHISDIDGPIGRQEEAFRQGHLANFPMIRGSNRAYTAFLNRMRADAFDTLVNNLDFTPTPTQLKAIAHFVNVFSGRGDLGSHKAAAETLSTVLWSPRLLTSRIQMLAMEPLLRKDAAGVRKVIAKQYGKLAGSAAVILSLASLAGIEWEKDPRSSNFGKFKFGDTYVDPWAGLQQVGVFSTRLLNAAANSLVHGVTRGDYKNKRGELSYLGRQPDKKRGPYDSSASDLSWRFLLSKASPEISYFFEMLNREDYMGNPKTPLKTTAELAVPLSWQDFPDMAKEHGIPQATAFQILNLLGVGVQNQDSKPRQ